MKKYWVRVSITFTRRQVWQYVSLLNKESHLYSLMKDSLQSFAIPGSIFLSILSGFLFPFPVALFLVCLVSTILLLNLHSCNRIHYWIIWYFPGHRIWLVWLTRTTIRSVCWVEHIPCKTLTVLMWLFGTNVSGSYGLWRSGFKWHHLPLKDYFWLLMWCNSPWKVDMAIELQQNIFWHLIWRCYIFIP